jgi:hypothetical protein
LRKPLNYVSLKPSYVYQTVFFRENQASPGVKTGFSGGFQNGRAPRFLFDCRTLKASRLQIPRNQKLTIFCKEAGYRVHETGFLTASK